MTETVTDEQGIKEECEEKEKATIAEANRMTTSRRTGKRGRKPAKVDVKAKLERSRQSARECRARKKLRYQYLEELVTSREKAIYALRKELEMCKQWCMSLDKGKLTADIYEKLEMERKHGLFTDDSPKISRTKDWCELTLSSSDDVSDESPDLESNPRQQSVVGVPLEIADITPKGKGKGKTTSKQGASIQDKDMDSLQLVGEDQSGVSHVSGICQPKSDVPITPSSFTVDTVAFDTSSHSVVSGQSFLDSVDCAAHLIHCPANGNQTINPLELLSGSGSSVDVDPVIIGTLSSESQLQLGTLSETDISDVLEVIEKEGHL
ncbi:hypothetical protein LSH36_40g16018 [Paralvinella palmiformis]|uniref:BZIP domain-containing protein n=1 Tax=Paralvinella palmiformis TaxID=53620 RepID=A0AAD9NGI5_9ANNE|nr:hypothetical protein LSH36_40g16018 [Paralvinella palmiformis]